MKNIIPPVKGTRDFYPEQMAVRTWLYNTVRGVSESFGYQEWDAPFLETLELYAAKSGEELIKAGRRITTAALSKIDLDELPWNAPLTRSRKVNDTMWRQMEAA